MMKYEFTKSQDGLLRANVTIKTRVGLGDLVNTAIHLADEAWNACEDGGWKGTEANWERIKHGVFSRFSVHSLIAAWKEKILVAGETLEYCDRTPDFIINDVREYVEALFEEQTRQGGR